MKSKPKLTILMMIIPLIVAVLIMFPRLINPQFGLLDDFTMLDNVRNLMEGDWSMSYDLQAGRFRPVYWTYYALIYTAAGSNPLWFFFAHLALLLILLLEIRVLMKMANAKDWQILVTSLVFLLSMPIIENFYTLSKGEPLQLVFLLASLLGFEKIKSSQHTSTKALFTFFSFFSILFAMLVKETALIMIPIVGLWTGFAFFFQKNEPTQKRTDYLLFLGAAILAVLAYFGLRAAWGTASISGGTYTQRYDLTLQAIVARVLRWMTMYAFYFHYLLPLAVLTLIAVVSHAIEEHKQQVFNWIVWVLLWMVVLLPWEFAEVYYLLPISLGFAMLIGFLLPSFLSLIKSKKPLVRWVSIMLFGLTILLFLATLPNFFTHSRMQLTLDRVNMMMLESTSEIIPRNGELYNGLDSQNEYERNIQRYFQGMGGRDDISYYFIDKEVFENLPRSSGGIVIMPYINNQPRLTVRAGTEEKYCKERREAIFAKTNRNLNPLIDYFDDFQIVNINLPVLLCALIEQAGFCENPDPVIDLSIFSYGWEVYQIP